MYTSFSLSLSLYRSLVLHDFSSRFSLTVSSHLRVFCFDGTHYYRFSRYLLLAFTFRLGDLSWNGTARERMSGWREGEREIWPSCSNCTLLWKYRKGWIRGIHLVEASPQSPANSSPCFLYDSMTSRCCCCCCGCTALKKKKKKKNVNPRARVFSLQKYVDGLKKIARIFALHVCWN